MKSPLITGLILVVTLFSVSCNKEYTCVCENSTWYNEHTVKSFSRSEAALRCDNDSEEFGRPDRVVCQLK